MNLVLRACLSIVGAVAYLALGVLGEGSLATYLSHPALVAIAVVTIVAGIVSLFSGGNISKGVREDRSDRWVLVPFAIVGLLTGYLPALTDRIDFWTFGSETLRWIGAAIYTIGLYLRIAPVFVLRNRFSGLVAIQPDHTLVTTGLYSRIRNPSYLGLLLNLIGWSLAFRAGVGLVLTALIIPPLIVRMNAEERLLHEYFGDEYDAYRARTSRLIPGVY